MRVLATLPFVAVLLGGCATAPFQAPRDPGTVVLTVHNRASEPLSTRVCGPEDCSAPQMLAAGARSRFLVQPGSGSRAVVTAKRGDRVVDQEPVDFRPGDAIEVDIAGPECVPQRGQRRTT
jgi:hypothetical protein